ncbi:MurR/RpiR family transcriptional regulator [Carnobacterium inhibens]|uniref:SIS domain-containing protein n=1 Tax=Carnobacterium inhibens TaxID=147709 RepID=A0ABR7T966_9LACT|nr:MurR/RpiR family transcriptional regulator [Carnobacterium inhibens]MBC9824549.1 SIS domain-containing protein [Carnobacterium inhibens]
MELEAKINQYYNQLNDNETTIISYILQNKEKCQNISITQLANNCHTSKSSILRLTQKLGFSGFVEFKYSIKQSYETSSNIESNSIDTLMGDIEATFKLFKQTTIEPLIEKVYHSKRIYGYGTGWVQLNALNDFSRNFILSGKNTMILPSKTELKLLLPDFTKDDLIIIVSKSGEGKDISEVIKLLYLKEIPVLSITEFKNNDLASKTDYNLYFQSSDIYDKHRENSSKQTFTTVNIVLDMLYRAYIQYENSL